MANVDLINRMELKPASRFKNVCARVCIHNTPALCRVTRRLSLVFKLLIFGRESRSSLKHLRKLLVVMKEVFTSFLCLFATLSRDDESTAEVRSHLVDYDSSC